ncbi:hypothetical protein [Pontivivens insulae]|uniref:Aspartate-semialdehyde dehydrogenase n=1 Tax=Pontivivens insulae TaxID=1639689 RepID=A0A2R8AFM2_9RHOB|nr:hypothetical protein [Pontivivens insulae]RED12262.1 hypothetical protein DFR53_2979 [Pontivivens insulae]SPF31019.1 hypothetical protein POI8812_03369 [Pontivivens insulae]
MKRISIRVIALMPLAACAPADTNTSQAPSTEIEFSLARSGFIVPGEGTDGLVAFGALEGETVLAATRALGTPSGRTSNAECGAGPLDFVNYEEISLHFFDGEFAGWSLTPSSTLETRDGIGLGDSEGQLTATYATQIVMDSLGREFDAEGFYGLIEAGEISNMWAGISCVFR